MSKSESCATRSGQPTNVPQRIFGSPKAKSQKRHYIEILVRGCECECVVFTSSYVHYILRIFIFGIILSTSWLVGVRVLEYSFILIIIVERE
jgi:hypothetical protein